MEIFGISEEQYSNPRNKVDINAFEIVFTTKKFPLDFDRRIEACSYG